MSGLQDHIAQLKAVLAAHAAQDDAFRADLLADPKVAIEKALNAPLPAHVKIQVIEEASDTYVVVLPATSVPASDGELSDDELESVAGGMSKAQNVSQGLGSGILIAPVYGVVVPALGIGMISQSVGDKKTADGALGFASDLTKTFCG